MTAVATPTLRWSSARTCPRKAILEATAEPDREWSESERRIMFRGQRVGQDFAVMLAAAQNALIWVDSGSPHWVPPTMLATKREYAAFVCELRVPWLGGVGHVDILAVETNTVIEILSSRYSAQAHSKLLQATGYAMEIDAAAVCLAIVDPGDLSEQRTIVVKGSPQWNVLAAEVEERKAEIATWQGRNILPKRVCAKPADARSHWCRHASTCFEGWTPDPLPIVDTEEARQAAARFAQAKKTEQDAKQVLDQAEKQRREAQAALAEHDLPAGETMIGPFKVKRIHYKGRESFQLAMAKEDSRLEPSLLAEFVNVGAPYDVYKIERTTDETVSVEDFGDVPWTDDDL